LPGKLRDLRGAMFVRYAIVTIGGKAPSAPARSTAGGAMSSFAEFYLATKDAAFRAVLAAGANRSLAEDSVAEAYARACARWETVGAHPDPFAWVLRTAFNCQRSWWRRTRLESLGASWCAACPAGNARWWRYG
jgi:DNA-directed RNA polymerase specialized sigma24 family protein